MINESNYLIKQCIFCINIIRQVFNTFFYHKFIAKIFSFLQSFVKVLSEMLLILFVTMINRVLLISTSEIPNLDENCANQVSSHPKFSQEQIEKFKTWKIEFNTSINESDREAIETFIKNDEMIESFNLSNSTYKQGLNKYSHLSYDQFKSSMTGMKLPKDLNMNFANISLSKLNKPPRFITHRKKMGPVKGDRNLNFNLKDLF